MASKKFGFVTCVQLGMDVMEEIYDVGGELSLALTLEDDQAADKSGRVYLDGFAGERDIPLVKVRHINDSEAVAAIEKYELDRLFIIGWSQIASAEVLAAPTDGCVGMHPTLLPEGRGRASIPWAILKGLRETGVTMFEMDEGVDTGPILAQHRIPLAPETDASQLYASALMAHRRLIRDHWEALSEGAIKSRPQDPTAGTTWPGRTPADGQLLPSMSVEDALRLVRATTHPYPGAFWRTPMGTLRVWKARRHMSLSEGPLFDCLDGTVEAVEYRWED